MAFRNKINSILNKINNKVITLSLYLSLLPSRVYALDKDNVFLKFVENFGNDTFDGVSLGAVKVVLITTALRFMVEYSKGGSKYRFYDIAKQCITVLVMIFVLPHVPTVIDIMVKKYIELKF